MTSRQKCETRRRKVYALAGRPSSRINTGQVEGLVTTQDRARSRKTPAPENAATLGPPAPRISRKLLNALAASDDTRTWTKNHFVSHDAALRKTPCGGRLIG